LKKGSPKCQRKAPFYCCVKNKTSFVSGGGQGLFEKTQQPRAAGKNFLSERTTKRAAPGTFDEARKQKYASPEKKVPNWVIPLERGEFSGESWEGPLLMVLGAATCQHKWSCKQHPIGKERSLKPEEESQKKEGETFNFTGPW